MARAIAALIRHGDYHQLANTPSAHQPFPLNKKGEAEAEAAIEIIRSEMSAQGWRLSSEIHTSRLLRAWQTSQIIAAGFTDVGEQAPQLIENSALAERCVGSAANLTVNEIAQIVEQDPRFDALPENWKSSSHFCLPLQGAESLMDAGNRVAGYLSSVMGNLVNLIEQDTLQLFVGHGAAFRHAAHQLGVLSFEQIAQLSMYHAQPVFIERLANGQWQHIAGNWKVRSSSSAYTD